MKKNIWLFKLALTIGRNRLASFLKKNKSRPYKLSIKLTDECNFYCSTCGNWKLENKKRLPLNSIKERSFRAGKDLFILTITGGEPFIDAHFLIEVINIFKKNCPNLNLISINTNGFYSESIKKVINETLSNYGSLTIMIGVSHVPNKNWGEKRTGVPQAYKHYQNTLEYLISLKRDWGRRIDYYKMFTLSTKSDIKLMERDEKLWLNFVEKGYFYNNSDMGDQDFLTNRDKLQAITNFRMLNKGNIGFLNKRFLFHWEEIIKNGKRSIKCHAGLNRMFLDSDNQEYICIKQLRSRSEMDPQHCKQCWTACEGIFDILGNFPRM
jgi:MoaA/NifB/PqqE/SkfB family radical SAM enzyme